MTEGDAGTKQMPFTLTLDKAPTEAVTVDVDTTGGSATSGVDYAPVSQTVTFDPGQTSKQVNVTINGDTAVEPNESIILTVSGDQLTGNAVGAGTILNDDVSTDPTFFPVLG